MTTNTQNTFSITAVVEALIQDRCKWEEGSYAVSNSELYALLGRTLDLYVKVRADRALAKSVNHLLELYGITFNTRTRLSVKIVRLVFVGKGRERSMEHRAFAYARVLEVAAAAGTTGDALPQFIIDRHGVDEIRRQAGSGLTEAQKAQQARDYAEGALSTATAPTTIALTDDLQPADGDLYSVALVRKNADGTGSIVFGTNNRTAIGTVMAIAGKALRDAAVIKAEADIARNDEAQRAANLERLVSEMVAMQGGFQPQMHVATPVTQPAHA